MAANIPISMSTLSIDDAAAHLAGEDEQLVRWLNGGPGTIQTVADYLRHCQERWENGGPVFAFAIRTEADRQLAGTAEVQFGQPYLKPGQVNVTYGVYPQWRHRGIATAAVGLACEFARAKGALQAVIRADPVNIVSQAVARRSGFTLRHETGHEGRPLQWWVRDLPTADDIPPGLEVSNQLILPVGRPGCGKSRLARLLTAAGSIDPQGIVSADQLKLHMFPGITDSDVRDPAVFAEVDRLTHKRLKQGLPVFVDATNVRHAARARLIAIAGESGRLITAVRFTTAVPVALVRNLARDHRLPDDMIRAYAAVMAAQASENQLAAEGIGTIINIT